MADSPREQPRPVGTGAMNRQDAERWAAARTLADLGELTAQWLEGKLEQTPIHCGPPAAETGPLTALLVTVNRAGFVTHQSQPGIPIDQDASGQRANVSGYADSPSFARLMAAVSGADLIVTAGRALGNSGFGALLPITLADGIECTWDGIAESCTGLEHGYLPYCHREVVDAVCGAWQITLIDPQWDRNDVLWTVLQRFAATRDQQPDPGPPA
jgi:uncharacterized protein DUF6919